MVYENLEATMYEKNEIVFHMETFIDDMLINTNKLKAIAGETEGVYAKNFNKIFGENIWGK